MALEYNLVHHLRKLFLALLLAQALENVLQVEIAPQLRENTDGDLLRRNWLYYLKVFVVQFVDVLLESLYSVPAEGVGDVVDPLHHFHYYYYYNY